MSQQTETARPHFPQEFDSGIKNEEEVYEEESDQDLKDMINNDLKNDKKP